MTSMMSSCSPVSSSSSLSRRRQTSFVVVLVICICLMFGRCHGYSRRSSVLVGGKLSRWGQLTKRCIQAKAGVSSSFMLQMATDSGTSDTIISPFAPGEGDTSTSTDGLDDDYELELTRDNVELVLDEMRPFLKADGYDCTHVMTVRKYS